MCALLGMDFTNPIFAGVSFKEFGALGEEKPDGWGLAWYSDQSASLIKEPRRWHASAHLRFLSQYEQIRAQIYLLHVRHRTVGGLPTHADTHPFQRECEGYDFCFVHNGTIKEGGKILPIGRWKPVGTTDSERLFCSLLERISTVGALPLESQSSWRWLQAELCSLNQFGQLNCLLSDGKRLFCYRDLGGWKGMMCNEMCLFGNELRHFSDSTIDLEGQGETLNRGILVSTSPLTGDGWKSLQPGELLVVREGRVQASIF